MNHNSREKGLTLLSIHKSKGLEFQNVILDGLSSEWTKDEKLWVSSPDKKLHFLGYKKC